MIGFCKTDFPKHSTVSSIAYQSRICPPMLATVAEVMAPMVLQLGYHRAVFQSVKSIHYGRPQLRILEVIELKLSTCYRTVAEANKQE